MNGEVVTAKWPVDSVRVEVIGTGRAVQLPSQLVLSVDDVLRSMVDTEEELLLFPSEDDGVIGSCWTASLGHFLALGKTPWQAIVELATKLQWDGRAVRGNP